jgi:ABC-type multidrug transport system fused ATPase/permease subunit
MQDFPLLSALLILPLVGAAVALALPRVNEGALRALGIGTSLAAIALSVPLWFLPLGFLVDPRTAAFRSLVAGDRAQVEQLWFVVDLVDLRAAGVRLEAQAPGVPGAGSGYPVGIEGVGLLVVLLATLLVPLTFLSLTRIFPTRVKVLVVVMLVLETAMLGTFLAFDLVLFCVFWVAWALALVPAYFLAGRLGGPRRVYPGVKVPPLTAAGSVVMLLAIAALWLLSASGPGLTDRTFDPAGVWAAAWSRAATFDLAGIWPPAWGLAALAALGWVGTASQFGAVRHAPAQRGVRQSPGRRPERPAVSKPPGAPAARKAAADKPAPERGQLGRIVRLLTHFVADERRSFLIAFALLLAEAVTAVFEAYPLAYLVDFLKGDRPDLSTALGLAGVGLAGGGAPLIVTLAVPTGGDTPQVVTLAVAPLIFTIAVLSLAIVLLAMINSLADSLAEVYLAKGGRMLGFNLRAALYAHLQRLSLGFHVHRRTGDVLTRVTSDVAAIETFVTASVSDLVGSVLVLAGTLAFLLYNAWQAALLAVVLVPVLALVSNYFSQRIKAAAEKQRAREGDLASTAEEMLTSIRVVQTYSREGHEQQRFVAHSRKTVDAALEAARLQASFSWVVKVLESLAIVATVWLGLWLIDRAAITVGTLLLFIILIQNMFKPTRKIIREWNTIGRIYASVERISDLLERKPGVVDAPDAVDAPPFKGQVEFRHVSFAYPAGERAGGAGGAAGDGAAAPPRLALQHVSFSVAPGEVLALVGHTGAGKSTIAQLLPRLYDPQAGQILIDGHDIRTFKLDSLRAQISMVLQETILFSGSVADNIAYGRAEATDAEIVEAAIRANAHEFIQKLPEGYATPLGERGANLSGGQRQLLAIARAFIRNTPILILDEPATGLDAESTELVLRVLRTLMTGKTTLVISHDLNLIRHADKIVVIREGQIEQVGTHESLLAAGGLYARLYAKQAGRAAAGAAVEAHPAPPRPARWVERRVLDPLESPVLHAELPGLRSTLDAEAMREHLQRTLLQRTLIGAGRGALAIERCRPGKITYLAGDGCVLRYELEVRDRATGRTLQPLVNARLFRSWTAGVAYVLERLAPLAAAMRADGREEVAPFARPAAILARHNLAVSVFPIDGELPALVDATDRRRMLGIFRETLPAALTDGFAVEDCRVELGHYGRRHRCVLRYQVVGRRPGAGTGAGATQPWLIYGKLAVDDRGALAGPVTAALRERLRERADGCPLTIPRALGYRPELRLALLEAIPGEPRLAEALEARVRGQAAAVPDPLTLEEMIDACAGIASLLHTSGIGLGRRRALDDDLAALRAGIGELRRISPELGAQLQAWLARVEAAAGRSDSLPPCLSHGDFTHTQVLFDGVASGLVDFDTVCQAEPALDLGQFLAYLRLEAQKAQQEAAVAPTALAEPLWAGFLDTYLALADVRREDEALLRRRVTIYELVSLLRIALHSWQKLKGTRIENVMAVLEERVACLS